MKAFCGALLVLLFLGGCSEPERVAPSPEPARTEPAPAAVQSSGGDTSSDAGGAGEPVQGVWAGQLRIDAHAGTATLNYVGAESGDFVPIRFRTGSESGARILAECADEDLCEVEGTVRFLDEPPPENASAVGEILRVDGVKRLPPPVQ